MTLSNSDVSEEISELISEVGERYGIGSLITARRLTGGYANDVFRLDADGPPTVLHLKRPQIDADSLTWEHRLLAKLEQTPAGGARPGAGSRWLNLVLVSRPPRLADPPGRRVTVLARTTDTLSPWCWAVCTRLRSRRPPRPNHARLLQQPAPATAPNPSVSRTVAHRHRPSPH